MEKSRKSVRYVNGRPGDHVTNLAPEKKEKLMRRRNDELPGDWETADNKDAKFKGLFDSEDSNPLEGDS